MEYRKEALVIASEIIQRIDMEFRKLNDSTVSTVGQIEVRPHTATVIPVEAEMTFETRSRNKERLETH